MTIDEKELLKNKDVIEEIKRHLWLESEKAGHDIGFEKAVQDWLRRYAQAWMDYHMPQEKKPHLPKAAGQRIRRAKSYL
mgnify:CR=1 FL=1